MALSACEAVTIDGTNDAVPGGVPMWEAVDGPQGQIFTHSTFASSGVGRWPVLGEQVGVGQSSSGPRMLTKLTISPG